MRRRQRTAAAGVTLAGLGVLVGVAIGSSAGTPALPVRREQPVQVRTQVIHRTIQVYRRAKPPHVAAAGPGRGGSAASGSAIAARTRASAAAHAVATGTSQPVVSTRSSGSHPASQSAPAPSRTEPVRTHTSGSHSVPTAQHHASPEPVRTRTSGAASGGSGSPTSARPVTTRSSGGRGGDGGGGRDD